MPDAFRRAACGCTWLLGSDDTGCQDDDCPCRVHHIECEACGAVVGIDQGAGRAPVAVLPGQYTRYVLLCRDCKETT